jgi:hypothetical protein
MKHMMQIMPLDNGGYMVSVFPLTWPNVPVAQEYAKNMETLLAIVERLSAKLPVGARFD